MMFADTHTHTQTGSAKANTDTLIKQADNNKRIAQMKNELTAYNFAGMGEKQPDASSEEGTTGEREIGLGTE